MDNLSPSMKFVKLFEYLHSGAADIKEVLGVDWIRPTISAILRGVLLGLTEGTV